MIDNLIEVMTRFPYCVCFLLIGKEARKRELKKVQAKATLS